MKDFARRNKLFLCISLAALLGLGLGVLLTPKAEFHLWLNSCHTAAGDVFFSYYTLIGGFAIYVLAVGLLFRRFGYSLFILLSEGISAAIVQAVKHIVNMPRPKIFFDLANNPDALPIVEGIRLHSWHSFPSGHTASFAVLFFCTCILLTCKNVSRTTGILIQVACAIGFLLGAYSRIYLSQHFAEDVFVGGIIGLLSVFLAYLLSNEIKERCPKLYDWRIAIPD